MMENAEVRQVRTPEGGGDAERPGWGVDQNLILIDGIAGDGDGPEDLLETNADGRHTPDVQPNTRMDTLERKRLTYTEAIRHATTPRVLQPLPKGSKGTASPDLERLFFRWWKNSCHMHTFLEGMIFPIIEAGREDIFKATLFGQTLTDAYWCS